MTIIIELTNRDRKALERHTFQQQRVTIGRAYDNDLIIPDSYADPHHAVITLDETGELTISDLYSTNGIWLNRQPLSSGKTHISSGTDLLIGETHIRVLTAAHVVAPAIVMTQMERLFNRLAQARFTVTLLMFCLLLTTVNNYQSQPGEIKFVDLGLEGLTDILSIVGWAAIWAIIGRISRHEFRFQQQLIASILYFTCYFFIEWSSEILAFNISNQLLASLYKMLLYGIALSGLFLLNFRFAFLHPSKNRRLVAIGIAWSIISLIGLSRYASIPEFAPQPSYASTLLPDYFRVVIPASKSQFLKQAEVIFQTED